MSRTALVLFSLLLAVSLQAQHQPRPEQRIIQQLLDLPELQGFYHAEIPGRLPLKLIRNVSVPPGVTVQKFNQPVLLLSEKQVKVQQVHDYLLIQQLPATSPDTLMYSLHYPIEGVVCKVRFIKQQQEWVVYEYSVAEL